MELKIRIFNKEINCYINNDSSGIMVDELNDLKPHLIVEYFTQIKDKNGQDIYYGDVIKNEHGGVWYIESIYDIYDLLYCESHSRMGNWAPEVSTIIGNVNQNPELFKKI